MEDEQEKKEVDDEEEASVCLSSLALSCSPSLSLSASPSLSNLLSPYFLYLAPLSGYHLCFCASVAQGGKLAHSRQRCIPG